MTQEIFLEAAVDMVTIRGKHCDNGIIAFGSGNPLVPDSDRDLAGDSESPAPQTANAQGSSLPEQMRFLSQSYKELEVLLDPNTKCIWCYQRPKGPPSFTPVMIRELTVLHREIQALATAQRPDEEPLIRYCVLASQIPGIFNLGGDLSFIADRVRHRDRDAIRWYAYHCVDVVYNNAASFDCGIVSVALVQGDALGGGLESALSCNFIVVERGAKIGTPEILFNLFPGMGAYSMLSRRLGLAMAERIALSGRIYSADEMYDLGVVDLVVENGSGEEAVRDYIGDIRKYRARQAIYRARQRANPVTLAELRDITDIWVETAMQLSDADLRHMSLLQSAQTRRLRREAVLHPQSETVPLPPAGGR
jgi:DSF synthase